MVSISTVCFPLLRDRKSRDETTRRRAFLRWSMWRWRLSYVESLIGRALPAISNPGALIGHEFVMG
jgi:hypothetical protein